MNPFAAIAAGYGRHRPPVHAEILRRVGLTPVDCAIDIGCGSGLSTLALAPYARQRIGIEPMAAMVETATSLDPQARFLVAPAESIPLPDQSANLLTAAGSLNYADLNRFFPEALRLLKPGGHLLVYDFSTGQPASNDWLARFVARYPWAPNEARHLNPEILQAEARGFTLQRSEAFHIPLTLSRDFYLEYMLTETNVAHAIRQGATLESIRDWCNDTLWTSPEARIIFPGYYALFVK